MIDMTEKDESAYKEWVNASGIMDCTESYEAWYAATELQKKHIQKLQSQVHDLNDLLNKAANRLADMGDYSFLNSD